MFRSDQFSQTALCGGQLRLKRVKELTNRLDTGFARYSLYLSAAAR
jgi:hypothetical protein